MRHTTTSDRATLSTSPLSLFTVRLLWANRPANWFGVLVLCLLSFGSLPAQEKSFNVVEVEVVGNKSSTAELIKSVANLPPGVALNSTVTREAVTRINGLGIFSEISLLGEEVTGGVKVYITVREYPKLTQVTYAGNKKIKSDDLKDKLKLNPGAYLSPFLVASKRQALLREYAEKGYYLTTAETVVGYNADSSEATLKFVIDERDKIKVRSVYLTGATLMDSSKLVGAMSNRKKGFLRSSNYNRDKYQEDLEKVVAEYQKNGFADAYVKSDSTHIDTVANRLDIYLETYEGPRYYFGVDSFSGTTAYTPEQLRRGLKYHKYDIFNQEKYDESIGELYSAYQEKGYLHTRIVDERKVRDSLIDLQYTITEGLPSKVNLVNIAGNVKTKDHVIRRELSVRPGQTFSRTLLIRSVRDVMALNYFSNAVPDVKDLPNGDVDVEVKVTEKQTGQFSAGAGYSARDKFVGNFGMGIPNLFGYGQSISFNVEFGGRRNSSSISFTEPWLFGKPTLFGTELFNVNRRYEGIYTEGHRGGSLRLGKRLKWPDNYFRASVSYRIEGNRFYDFDETYRARLLPQRDSVFTKDTTYSTGAGVKEFRRVTKYYDPFPGSLISLGEDWNASSAMTFSITRDSRNLPEFATAGSQFRYSATISGGPLGGHWRFHKHTGEFTKYLNLYKGISLAAQGQVGAIGAFNGDTYRVLETERFSPGGTGYYGIVRGYRDGSLTPDTLAATGDTVITINQHADSTLDTTVFIAGTYSTRVRANYMMVGNLEMTLPLAKNQFYFLTFIDVGNSWQKLRDIDPLNDMYAGAGFGFRLAVPGIGTIGFDFAYPLRKRIVNGIVEEQKWRTHFQVGTIFQ